MKAVEVLLEHGVPENRIIFINLVCLLYYGQLKRGLIIAVIYRSLLLRVSIRFVQNILNSESCVELKMCLSRQLTLTTCV